jgi:hypothetical protein
MLLVHEHGAPFCLFLEFAALLYNIVYIKVALFAVVFRWNKIIPLVTTRRRDQRNYFFCERNYFFCERNFYCAQWNYLFRGRYTLKFRI